MVVIVFVARWAAALPAIRSFMSTYPGDSALPTGAPVGFPAFVEWQHVLNSFFVLFILRSGWQIRGRTRPSAFWIRRNDRLVRTRTPPVRLGISTWLHLAVDALWVANGVVFYVLIFCTGQWARIVPTRWDVFPNGITTAIRYASLNWPTNDGWSNYNALQLISYFVTVFVAAPLAILTGVRLMPGIAHRFRRLDRVFPLRVARGVHVVVMVYFVAFIIVHVTLVLATGALRNLNHLYAGRDDQSGVGFSIFAGTVVLMVVLWIAAKPAVIARLAGLTGTVRR